MSTVTVGFFSFTEVTDPTQHRAYNEWHQLDHMPEQYPLEGVQFGQRWVLTPQCRVAAARLGEPLASIHYVTMYLFTGPAVATLRAFYDLGRDLARRGRFFDARRSHLAAPFRLGPTHAAPRVLVSPAAVAFRPHCGVYVIVQDAASSPLDLDDLVACDGVAGAWQFDASEEFAGLPWPVATVRVTVAWIDGELMSTAATVNRWIDRVGLDSMVFAAPFAVINAYEWDWFEPHHHTGTP